MKAGSLPKGHFRWNIILSLGRAANGKYKQKWVRFCGSRRQAEAQLAKLTTQLNDGDFIVPSKTTVAQWLEVWLTKVQGRLSGRSYGVYRNIVHTHILKSALAHIPLQRLTPSDVESYHYEKQATLSHATMTLHHVVLTSALKVAKRDKHVRDNVASDATERPGRARTQRKMSAWTSDEATKVLASAKTVDTQTAALICVAMDSGARKGELQGLRWTDVDLTTGKMQIERQLLKSGIEPVFGDTKTRRARGLDLCEETLVLLRAHRREQAELKIKNRPHYANHDLVFAQTWEHQGAGRQLGAPLTSGMIARIVERLVKATGVRRITVHGLRHTCATLALEGGARAEVVQQRLGHSNIATTLGTYAAVHPGQQADCSARIATRIHGQKAGSGSV